MTNVKKIGYGYSRLVQESMSDLRQRPAWIRWVASVASIGLVAVFVVSIAAPFGLLGNFDQEGALAAGTTNATEAESADLSGAASIGSDNTAAGGSYLQLNVTSGTTSQSNPDFQPTAPYYATFYYPWFKNATTDGSWSGSTWEDNGHNPPANWFSNYLPDKNPNAFDPSSELYSSNDDATLYWQFANMAKAKQEVAISSWWGQGHKTDTAFSHILKVMNNADNPYPNLRWAIYYEKEGFGDPSVSEIASDLKYIVANYGNQRAFFRINNKPVIFVYGDANDGQAMVTRWAQARAEAGVSVYLVLKVFPGYQTATSQPDSWHQYAPAARTDSQADYTFVSPGFWRSGDPVRLARDLTDFQSKVQQMVAAPTQWKLTETWNEWGEGTAVEPGTQVNQTTSGNATINTNAPPFGTAYIDTLAKYLPGLEQGTGQGTTASAGSTVVVAAAGDIACGPTDTTFPCQQQAVATAIQGIHPNAVLALGDLQYEDGSLSQFMNYYDKSWGAFKNITYPVLGNHEYGTSGASGYFDYFNGTGRTTGVAGTRGQGYYSFDLGSWHIVALNANCDHVSCAAGSAQEKWLRADLAAHQGAKCTLAMWHQPRYTSGHDEDPSQPVDALFQVLYDYNADIVLSGHSHSYERFAPQNNNSQADTARGIRQFVVGTGGRDFTGWRTILPNSEARQNTVFGALKLTLKPTSYDWQFVPISGQAYSDSGTNQACH